MPNPETRDVVLTADTVTERLRHMILTGEIGIGVQLKQEALARHFGVSRVPVREALNRLEVQGLITHIPHVGSVVARRSLAELIESLDIRVALECRAIALAIPNMTNTDIRECKKIIARYEASDDPREWTELNLEFHLRLYQASNRPKLMQMIKEIVRGIDIHLRQQLSYQMGKKSPQDDHRAILDACRRKNVEEAVSLLQQHIEHNKNALSALQKEASWLESSRAS